jgi:hypothetical protein
MEVIVGFGINLLIHAGVCTACLRAPYGPETQSESRVKQKVI